MSVVSKQTEAKRRAYQCLRCLHKKNEVYIEAKYRVTNHILKHHLSLDDVPCYCKLCLFRCFKESELREHVKTFARHALMLKEKGVQDSPDMLVVNRFPYVIGERDMVALSAEESARHWASKSKGKDLLAQAVETSFPGGLLPESPLLQSTSNNLVAGQLLQSPVIAQLHQLLGTVLTGGVGQMQPSQPAQLTQPTNLVPQPVKGSFVAPEPFETGLEELLDYEDDLPEHSHAEATPTLDERPEPLTTEPVLPREDAASSSSSSSSVSSASSTERKKLLLDIKTAVEANTEALKRQEAALLQLAQTVKDMSESLAHSSHSRVDKKRKLEEEKTDRHRTQDNANKRAREDQRDREDRRNTQNYHRCEREHSHHKDRRDRHR